MAKEQAEKREKEESADKVREVVATPVVAEASGGLQLDNLESDFNARLEAEQKEREDAARREQEEEEERKRAKKEKRKREQEAAQALKDEEERARRELEEAERKAAEKEQEQARAQDGKARAKAEAEAAAQARKEARAREKAEAEARKKADLEKHERKREDVRIGTDADGAMASPNAPGKWGKPAAIGMFVLLLVLVGVIHIMPMNGLIPVYEKLASERFGQPVSIGTVHVALLPLPQMRFEQVSIGAEPRARFTAVRAVPELGSMFGDVKIFKSVELEGAVVPPAMLAGVLWGRPGSGQDLRIERFAVRGLKTDFKGLALPPLNVDGTIAADGKVQGVNLSNADRSLTGRLLVESGGVKIELSSKSFQPLFGAGFAMDDFSAKGVLTADELSLSEFEAKVFEGYLNGNARLKWGAEWTLDGEVAMRLVEAAKLAPQFFSSGKLEGKGSYAMRSADASVLFASTRLEGNLKMEKGTLNKIDLTRLLQQSGSQSGGSTLFSELNSGLILDGGRLQFRNLRLSAGAMSATGAVEIGATGEANGRLQVELRSGSSQARASLALSGNVKDGLVAKR